MREQLKLWYSVIQKNTIRANNNTSTDGIVAVINVLELPDTDTSVVAVSLAKDGNKKSALQPKEFMKFMFGVENCMDAMCTDYKGHNDPLYFVNTSKQLSSAWYIALNCHRVFFIPKDISSKAPLYFMRKSFIDFLKTMQINKVVVRVDTADFNFTTVSK